MYVKTLCEPKVLKWYLKQATTTLFFFLQLYFYIFTIYLFLAVLRLHCCAQAFSSCGE